MSMLNFSMLKYSLKTRTYFWNSNGGKTQFRANFVIWSLQLNPSTKHTVTSRTVPLVALFLDLNKAWFRKNCRNKRKIDMCNFPLHDCTQKETVGLFFSSLFRQCKWPSLSRNIRDLTIRQRWRQWKRRWKIDFAPFKTFSPLNQVTRLFESREVRSELKRGGCVRVERESKMYRFAVSVLTSYQNLVISRCSFAGTAKKCTKKRDARVELLFCSLN